MVMRFSSVSPVPRTLRVGLKERSVCVRRTAHALRHFHYLLRKSLFHMGQPGVINHLRKRWIQVLSGGEQSLVIGEKQDKNRSGRRIAFCLLCLSSSDITMNQKT